MLSMAENSLNPSSLEAEGYGSLEFEVSLR